MDPYCMIKCSNGQNFRTKTKKSEGQHPVWEETFNISVTSMGDEIFLQCFDDDVFGSDLIGETTFPIYKLCVPDGKTQSPGQQSYPLIYKNMKAGEIILETKYIPPQSSEPTPQERYQAIMLQAQKYQAQQGSAQQAAMLRQSIDQNQQLMQSNMNGQSRAALQSIHSNQQISYPVQSTMTPANKVGGQAPYYGMPVGPQTPGNIPQMGSQGRFNFAQDQQPRRPFHAAGQGILGQGGPTLTRNLNNSNNSMSMNDVHQWQRVSNNQAQY
ncbi:hypothetical protein FGO68_gene17020 [Halteria grandinella]|uniref:C2 domain-containing protein n=1 Tax=Halteria grandinella TaxID=5974 RepID=A0A8J8T4P4_HALGN|nr:hypothetical protein FGO68_gene17020 [Halteria grandinella]